MNGEETRSDKVISWTICLWVYLASSFSLLLTVCVCGSESCLYDLCPCVCVNKRSEKKEWMGMMRCVSVS